MSATVVAAATMVPTTAGCAMALEAADMLPTARMSGIADMALPVSRLVPLEVLKRLCTAIGIWPAIAVVRVVTVIHMAVKAARSVEPRTGTDKDTVAEPVLPVVAIGRAVIWRVIVVSIGAYRSGPASPDADRNLGGCRCGSHENARTH